MKKPFTSDNAGKDYLTPVIKTADHFNNWLFQKHDAVIQTDLHFNVLGWNIAAEKLYGQGEAIGKHLFEIINIEFIHSSIHELEKELALSGCWAGKIIFTRYNGQKLMFQITATYIYDVEGKAKEIIIAAKNIVDAKLFGNKPEEKEEIELENQKLINKAFMEAREIERNCIGEELHDNVNQILVSALLYMNTAMKEPEKSNELLEKAIEFQKMALEEIRMLSKTLSTSVVSSIGMKEGIEDILKHLKSVQNLNTKLELDHGITEKLSKEQKLMLYRIVQEQTTNIVKHAKAKNINVFLKIQNTTFSLLIADDGVGFNVKEKRNGIGLTNISNRVSNFNGKLKIYSAPGSGCKLEAIFPL